jgi:hypothetical protein
MSSVASNNDRSSHPAAPPRTITNKTSNKALRRNSACLPCRTRKRRCDVRIFPEDFSRRDGVSCTTIYEYFTDQVAILYRYRESVQPAVDAKDWARANGVVMPLQGLIIFQDNPATKSVSVEQSKDGVSHFLSPVKLTSLSSTAESLTEPEPSAHQSE